ncbi:hypothetical protein K2173_001402 [Erythroxylum novogranatense]|uniref:Non-specific lipid-transfer protein n=1 Tax=Erythroxylum novogranatense TaxID=1862640 RepID=A0AAV8T3M9_9ROSI|nr:hypothetical protein K2173_001402 [Erythroxylum novogranatense]
MACDSSMVVKLTYAVIICMVLVGAPLQHCEAITCGQVQGSLLSCLPYLQGRGPPSPACCNGVRGLNAAAKTKFDRQQVCRCLKSLASGIRGINYGLGAALPGKCGVRIPFTISPSTDCNRIN